MSRRNDHRDAPAEDAGPHDRPALAPGGRRRLPVALVVMVLMVLAAYVPRMAEPDHNTLYALDYHQLHSRRIRFAQDALRADGALPAWYPRELMGTPYWSNLQNFPFIPTRLLLLPLDPLDAAGVGVGMAAALAAVFTYAFTRRVGMTPVGAAAAGWTFACAGFFASRVMAGHLPLLEAYPALPLLLWLVEACVNPAGAADRGGNDGRRPSPIWLAALAVATTCVLLAGHPQLPVYAGVVAGLYLLYRGRRRWRLAARAAGAMALGAGCAAFALWPMAQLAARSTRVLKLAPASNDIAFPYRRLLAFLFPWADGWPEGPLNAVGRPFTYGGSTAYFWDTVCYVGWVPLLATAFLLLRRVFGARRGRGAGAAPAESDEGGPKAPWLFFAVVGTLALIAALPVVQQVTRLLPGTILRSPARQIYVTTFALALATGIAVDVLLRRRPAAGTGTQAGAPRRAGARGFEPGIAGPVIVAVLLLIHVVDLGRHTRAFIRSTRVPPPTHSALEHQVRSFVGAGRVGIDYTMTIPFNRMIDDVGFFESIMLAKPYAALLALAGAPPTLNVQNLSGSELPRRALETTGVRLLITFRERPDLPSGGGVQGIRTYTVPNPLPRAAFLPASAVMIVDAAETHRRLRDPAHDVGAHVMLPPGTALLTPSPLITPATAPSTAPAVAQPEVAYARPSSDEIILRVRAAEAGVLRVLESWDPGWSATLNGVPADVLCADDVFLATPLPPGEHEVRFRYHTPGATTGIVISLASLCLLVVWILWRKPSRDGTAPAATSGAATVRTPAPA